MLPSIRAIRKNTTNDVGGSKTKRKDSQDNDDLAATLVRPNFENILERDSAGRYINSAHMDLSREPLLVTPHTNKEAPYKNDTIEQDLADPFQPVDPGFPLQQVQEQTYRPSGTFGKFSNAHKLQKHNPRNANKQFVATQEVPSF